MTADWPWRSSPPAICLAAPFEPLPGRHGGGTRTFHLLAALHERARWHVLAFCHPAADRPADLSPLTQLGVAVTLLPLLPPPAPRLLLPETVAAFAEQPGLAAIQSLCRQRLFDVLDVQGFELAYHLRDCPARLRVITVHELPSEREHSLWRHTAGARQRSAMGQWLRWQWWEAALGRQYDGLLTLTAEERARLVRALPDKPIVHVATGVEPPPEPLPLDRDAADVGFYGSFGHLPNVHALRFLLTRIWPTVIERQPQSSLLIGGDRIPDELRVVLEKTPGARWFGPFADAWAFWRKARVLCAPIVSGGGIRLKTIEALVAGRPVVTTPRGAWGIATQASPGLLLAESGVEFAAALGALLGDPDRQREAAAAAFALGRRFSRERTAEETWQAYAAIAARAGGARDL